MATRVFRLLVLTGAILMMSPAATKADIIDLMTAGNTGTAAGAIGGDFFVQQIPDQSTGTGTIHSFVRIQQTGSEQGYNTDLRPVSFDENTSPTFTRHLSLSLVPIVTINGTAYRQFLLDINQTSNNPFLSLNQLQIFQSVADRNDGTASTPSAGNAPVAAFGAGSTEIFRMNNSGDPNFTEIQMDYSLNSGSGSGDMFLYVPDADFNALFGDCVILYSQFGNPCGEFSSNDGFEEWAVLLNGPGNPTPAPAGVVLLGLGGALTGLYTWRKRRQAKVA